MKTAEAIFFLFHRGLKVELWHQSWWVQVRQRRGHVMEGVSHVEIQTWLGVKVTAI